MKGYDIYGNYTNYRKTNHSWSIAFNQWINKHGTTKFMFSNGDCSQYIVTTFDQISSFKSIDATSTVTILSSNISPDNWYKTQWYLRNSSSGDPLISYYDQSGINDDDSLLYAEDNINLYPSVTNGKYFNVWIEQPINIYSLQIK